MRRPANLYRPADSRRPIVRSSSGKRNRPGKPPPLCRQARPMISENTPRRFESAPSEAPAGRITRQAGLTSAFACISRLQHCQAPAGAGGLELPDDGSAILRSLELYPNKAAPSPDADYGRALLVEQENAGPCIPCVFIRPYGTDRPWHGKRAEASSRARNPDAHSFIGGRSEHGN